MRRVATWAPMLGLTGLVSLLTHQLGYALADVLGLFLAEEATDHGHMSVLWALVTPGAVVASALFLLRQVHRFGVRTLIRPTRLAPAAGIAFLLQESIELLVAGRSLTELVSAPVLLGLALVPVLAQVVLAILGGVGDLVRRWLGVDRAATPRPALVRRPQDVSWTPLGVPAVIRTRGPPRRF